MGRQMQQAKGYYCLLEAGEDKRKEEKNRIISRHTDQAFVYIKSVRGKQRKWQILS